MTCLTVRSTYQTHRFVFDVLCGGRGILKSSLSKITLTFPINNALFNCSQTKTIEQNQLFRKSQQ